MLSPCSLKTSVVPSRAGLRRAVQLGEIIAIFALPTARLNCLGLDYLRIQAKSFIIER